MTTFRHVYRLPGDAFSGTVCRGLPALRAPAQSECRQPAQLNAPQVALWLTANEEKDASTEQLIDDDLTFDGNLGFSVFKLQVRRA